MGPRIMKLGESIYMFSTPLRLSQGLSSPHGHQPNPRPQEHTAQAVLYVDSCHSELTFTVSLKHQTKTLNDPEGIGLGQSHQPALLASVFLSHGRSPTERQKQPQNRVHRAWRSLCLTMAVVCHLTCGLAEPAGCWEGRASLTLHTYTDPHAPVPGHGVRCRETLACWERFSSGSPWTCR